jgi:hypothetical protein
VEVAKTKLFIFQHFSSIELLNQKMQHPTNVPNIIVVGSSNMDLIAYTPQLPKRGETLRGYKFRTVCSNFVLVFAKKIEI